MSNVNDLQLAVDAFAAHASVDPSQKATVFDSNPGQGSGMELDEFGLPELPELGTHPKSPDDEKERFQLPANPQPLIRDSSKSTWSWEDTNEQEQDAEALRQKIRDDDNYLENRFNRLANKHPKKKILIPTKSGVFGQFHIAYEDMYKFVAAIEEITEVQFQVTSGPKGFTFELKKPGVSSQRDPGSLSSNTKKSKSKTKSKGKKIKENGKDRSGDSKLDQLENSPRKSDTSFDILDNPDSKKEFDHDAPKEGETKDGSDNKSDAKKLKLDKKTVPSEESSDEEGTGVTQDLSPDNEKSDSSSDESDDENDTREDSVKKCIVQVGDPLKGKTLRVIMNVEDADDKKKVFAELKDHYTRAKISSVDIRIINKIDLEI
ncbi:P protein [Rhizoctonia solani rhabdovirus 1]|nr:P protein [Rhizoctonia solani rhabdovirus 1]